MEHENDAVQDIKNEKAADSIDSVLQYLVRHYGSPARVEALARTSHDKIGKLYRPFLEGNTALCYAAIKGHRSTMNLVTSMISYYQENYPKDEALSRVHQGGLNPHRHLAGRGRVQHLPSHEKPDPSVQYLKGYNSVSF